MIQSNRFLTICQWLTAALFSLPLVGGPAAEEKSSLRIGSPGDPQTLDPHRYTLNVEEHILKDMFLGLTTMDAKGAIVPGSAESWDVSSDGLAWTFLLRDNAWSDGTPVSAEDFVYSFRRLLDPETAAPLAFFLYEIENAREINGGELEPSELGVSAPDSKTLEIRLERPFPYFTERLFYPTGYPVPKHVIEKHGSDWVKPENWVSNGPYSLTEWKPQQAVELQRNPHFYEHGNVKIESVKYVPVADALAGYHRYLAEELDIVGDFPAGEIESLRESHPDHLQLSPLLSTMYLVFNVTRAPFDDVRVRRALGLAIDRDKLTRKVLRSEEIANASMVPPLVPGYKPLVTTNSPDLALARSLLEQAGFTEEEPLKVTLRYFTGAESKQVHVAIAAMWQEIGVQTSLHNTELKVHFSDLHSGDFEVAQAGWFGENNPEHYIELLWSQIGSNNYGRYQSADFDGLLEQAKNTVGQKAREKLLQQAESVALNEFPVIPLYSVTVRNLVNPRVGGWYTNPRNSHGVRYMTLK